MSNKVAAAGNVPATVDPKTLVVASDYGDMAGLGFDGSSSDDTSMPFLKVIQSGSPEVKGDNKLKGAAEGMLVNSISKELFDGAEGVVFQPCATQHVFMEWKPKNAGGGLVGMHAIDSAIVKKCVDTQEFGKYKTDAGNDLVETYYLAGLLHRSANLLEQVDIVPEPVVMTFKSTGIKAYRAYFTRVYMVKGKIPLFAHRLRVTSKAEKNSKGDFVNLVLNPLVENDITKSLIPAKLGDMQHPLLVAGQALSAAYLSGQIEVKHEAGKDAPGGNGANGNDIPF